MTSSRASIACLFVLGLGCNPSVIESNNDEAAEDSTSESESEGSGSTSESEDSGSTSDDTSSTDDPCTPGTLDCPCDRGMCDEGLVCMGGVCTMAEEETETETETDTGKETETDTGEEKHQCGWDVREEYYFCGNEGVDPEMKYEISCEVIGFPMVPGAPCDDKLDYIGCCDANGDAWYCLNGFLEYEICGAG